MANNVWVQAMLDGGVPALVLELGMSVLVVVVLFVRRFGDVAPLAAAWLAVLGVEGMLTSYFFTLDVWLVLGLTTVGAAVTALDRRGRGAGEDPTGISRTDAGARAQPPAAPAAAES